MVDAKLEGKESEITQNVLAAEVFDRRGAFDPGSDPIVRIQAGRVRRALEHYYLTHRDPGLVRIVLPKGTYVPVFLKGESPPPFDQTGSLTGDGPTDSGVPVIVVCPFANLTGNANFDYVVRGLPMHIAVEADRTRDARILVSPVDLIESAGSKNRERYMGLSSSFCLRGALRTDKADFVLDVQLVRCATNRQIWANEFQHSQPKTDVATFLAGAARRVALMVLNEGGILYRNQIRQLPSVPNSHSSTHEAVLWYLAWQVAPDPEIFTTVVANLQEAVQRDPRSGIAKSFLARCYADLWALDFEGVSIRIEDALDLALAGLDCNPDDCRANGIVAYVYLVMDDIETALQYAETALSRARGSFLFMDGISYLLTLCGDWERGPALLQKVLKGNPFHAAYVHGALWVEAMRCEDYPAARRAAMAAGASSNFWGPLMRCVALAHLGDMAAATAQSKELLLFKPKFAERGDWLIRRYVKDDATVASVKKGLALAGLNVHAPPPDNL